MFQAEPVLYIGFAVNTSQVYETSSPFYGKWHNVHEPHIFQCVSYHTNYTFQMQFNDTTQNATLMSRNFTVPTVDTNAPFDAFNTTDEFASPDSKFVRPTDVAQYKLTAAYHSMGYCLRNFLRGSIYYSASAYPTTKSDITETRLVDSRTSYPVKDLVNQVQSFFEDMIITVGSGGSGG